MNWTKKISQVVATLIFVALLVGTALPSRENMNHERDEARLKETALTEFGFFLEPVDEEIGINFRHTSPDLDPKVANIAPQIASMGAAVSIVDFDNDGWEDIYFTNSSTGSLNALYRNLHKGKFEDVAVQMGIADVNQKGTGASMGSIWADYDNDGYKDLFLYKWGRPELYHNVNGERFENVTTGSGLPGWANANTAIWLDFNRDGLLDIFMAGYFSEEHDLNNLTTTKIMPEGFRYANNGGRNYLLANRGDGKFEDVTLAFGLNTTKWTLAAASTDFNEDGYQDLFVANDYNVNELYINNGGKGFTEVGRESGIGNIPKSGMCASLGDIKNVGILGVYNTTITEKGILIQDNNYWLPVPGQKDAPYPNFANLAQVSRINNAGWSYGSQFGDLNNDGNMDLYVANGFISADKDESYWYDFSKVTGGNSSIIEDASNWPDMKDKSQSGYEQNKIWINEGHGLFADASGLVCPYVTYDSRAVAMADLWNNGHLDVVVANQNNVPLIYKNVLRNQHHWIAYELHGTVSNADAVGAKVIVEWNGHKQAQVVTGGMGFSSQNQHRLHFGLGSVDHIDQVSIFWPSGKVTTLKDQEIDTLHFVKEDADEE